MPKQEWNAEEIRIHAELLAALFCNPMYDLPKWEEAVHYAIAGIVTYYMDHDPPCCSKIIVDTNCPIHDI